MSAPKARRDKSLSLCAAFDAVQRAAINLEGSAAIVSASVDNIGSTPLEKEAARYSADRLLRADVRLLVEAVDAMESAMMAGAA